MKDAGIAEKIAAACRDAFSNLVRKAIEAQVQFVVIAGDVYDREWTDNSVGLFFNREISKLAREGIRVFLIRGNHDAESVITSSIALPQEVTQFSTRNPETFEITDLRVAVHGRSFPHRAIDKNWALEYPPAKIGWFNIGLLHTSCDGREGHANYAPCNVDDLATRGYDYWALGHVHKFEILRRDPWIVYPGNIQGRSIRECGPKGAVIVDVVDGKVDTVERVMVDTARFFEISVDIHAATELAEVLDAVSAAVRPVINSSNDCLLALRLKLTGATALNEDLLARREQLALDLQGTLGHLHSDAWLEKLVIATQDEPRSDARYAQSSVDFRAAVDECVVDVAIRETAIQNQSSIQARFPAAIARNDSPEDVAALLAEARAFLLARVAKETN